jgi:hypothetical protein
MMDIINSNFKFSKALTKRKSTKYIILHHRAGNGDVMSIHNQHLGQGGSGIGYNFYVRKDGKVYSGRPIDTVGAHTLDYNSVSIGICFEGNFETEKMNVVQIKAGRELISYLKGKYPKAEVKKHRDFNTTACPGKKFPFDEVTKTEYKTVNEVVNALVERGIITDKDKWFNKVTPNSNAYWLAYKGANMTENISKHKNLATVNDILWELNFRGIIINKSLWKDLLHNDVDLYWLANKIANKTKNT